MKRETVYLARLEEGTERRAERMRTASGMRVVLAVSDDRRTVITRLLSTARSFLSEYGQDERLSTGLWTGQVLTPENANDREELQVLASRGKLTDAALTTKILAAHDVPRSGGPKPRLSGAAQAQLHGLLKARRELRRVTQPVFDADGVGYLPGELGQSRPLQLPGALIQAFMDVDSAPCLRGEWLRAQTAQDLLHLSGENLWEQDELNVTLDLDQLTSTEVTDELFGQAFGEAFGDTLTPAPPREAVTGTGR